MNIFLKYFHTIKDLKFIQIYSRIKKNIFRTEFRDIRQRNFYFKLPDLKADFPEKNILEVNNICFLNKNISFDDFFKPEKYDSLALLEKFTLHYMDFLLDQKFPSDKLKDFTEFYEKKTEINYCFAPYTVSLRLVNFFKFSHRAVPEKTVLAHIEKLGQYLAKNREFDLLGNHLLKNLKALIFWHIYFRHDDKVLFGELDLLEEQLHEQVLSDGWHFERTPTYHLIVLEDLLDIFNILPDSLIQSRRLSIREIIKIMLRVISLWNEEYPLFNDSSYVSARPVKEILAYAESLGFSGFMEKPDFIDFPDSGYYVCFKPKYSIWIDAGDLGPKYLPGHSHNDSLSFILYLNTAEGYVLPLLNDTGAGSYQDIKIRDIARSVKSHNTVMIDDVEPSFFWADFRYARKVKLLDREVKKDKIRARVGYCGRIHERTWDLNEDSIRISDRIHGKKAAVFFHLGEGLKAEIEGSRKTANVSRENRPFALIQSENDLEISESFVFPEMNHVRKRSVLSVKFSGSNEIIIKVL
jgi:hypothetical protein